MNHLRGLPRQQKLLLPEAGTVLAYNLKRVLNLVSFGDLMKAVAVQS